MGTFFISIVFGILLGVALSIDAFMLGLVYGLSLKTRKEILLTSFIVGLFHFAMPLIGNLLTYFILNNVFSITLFQTYFKETGTLILILLGFMMILKKDNNQFHNGNGIISKLLFAFSVSLDSFFVGIALTANHHINIFIIAITLFFMSCFITLTSLAIIYKTRSLIKLKNLNIIAGILLVLIGLINLLIG